MIITKVNAAGKVVITATNMLETMTENHVQLVLKYLTFSTLLSMVLMLQCFQVNLQMVNTHLSQLQQWRKSIRTLKLFLKNMDV